MEKRETNKKEIRIEEENVTLRFIREWNSIKIQPKELKKWCKEVKIHAYELKTLI